MYAQRKLIDLTISFISMVILMNIFISSMNGTDLEALSQCRSLYRIDADDQGTYYSNNHCLLHCNFTNRLREDIVNSGQPCRTGSPDAVTIQYTCQSGRCLPVQVPPHQQAPPTSPFAVPYSNRPNGLLSILSTKAELSPPVGNTYLMICVLNNVAEPIHHLPLEENYWINRCHSCSSDVVQNAVDPIYNSPCPMSTRYSINQNSKIIFEIWTVDSTSTPPLARGKAGQFVGGAHLRLKELIDHKKLGSPYTMQLSDGPFTGKITTEIEWS